MLKLYWAEISGLSEDYSALPLSAYRLARIEKIRAPEKRKQSIASELLLIRALKKAAPEFTPPFKISCGEHGKPELDDIPLYFSISHSGVYTACAVSDEPVGLDIEYDAHCRMRIAERFFTSCEKTCIECAEDKDKEFARLWTAKESVLKYIGTGLSKSLSEVHIVDNCTAFVEPGHIELGLIHQELDKLSLTVCTKNQEDLLQTEYIKLN